MNEGWLCPRCKKINAPWVSSCSCSESSLNPQPSWYNEDWWKEVTCRAPTNSSTESK